MLLYIDVFNAIIKFEINEKNNDVLIVRFDVDWHEK